MHSPHEFTSKFDVEEEEEDGNDNNNDQLMWFTHVIHATNKTTTKAKKVKRKMRYCMLTAMVFGIIRNQCIVATVQNTQWTNEWKELFSSGDKCSKWFQDDEMCLMLIFDFAAAQSIWFTNDKSWRCSSLCKTVFLGFNVWLFHLEQGHPRI